MVPLEDLVEVGVQALEDDAEVAGVHEVVEDADDVVLARGVVRLVEELEDAGLDDGLVEVGGLVLDDLDRHLEAGLGRAERHLAERAAAEHGVHLVPAGGGRERESGPSATPAAERRARRSALRSDGLVVSHGSHCNAANCGIKARRAGAGLTGRPLATAPRDVF